jgi:hypothetical protein
MERNVGGLDRIVRGILGIALLGVAAATYRKGSRQRAALAALAGIGMLQNATTCFCGGNYLLGIDTTSDSADEE